MPYPIDQIDALSAEYSLSEAMRKELAQVLSVDGIKELLDNSHLVLQNLISIKQDIDSKKIFVIPMRDVENILKIFTALKDTDLFKNKKISLQELFFWIDASVPSIYTIEPSICVLLVTNFHYFLPTLKTLPEAFNAGHKENYKALEKELIELVNSQEQTHLKSLALSIIEKYGVPFITEFFNFYNSHPILLLLKNKIERPIEHYLKLCGAPLQEKAAIFFSDLMLKDNKSIDEMTFSMKYSGVQYGTILNIDYHLTGDTSSKKNIKYFIKSHNQGHTYSQNKRYAHSSKDSVDLKELFVYKILEKLKIGPKSHFFYLDDSQIGGVYIATQDLGFSKKNSSHIKPLHIKSFKTFDQYKLNCKFTQEDKISNQTGIGVMQLDMIARVLKLTDMNEGNFGPVITLSQEKEAIEKWKFVDFRPPYHGSYIYENIINGFLAGNGTQSYSPEFKEILLSGGPIERLGYLITTLNIHKENFNNYAETSFNEVIAFYAAHNKNSPQENNPDSLISDLEQYKIAVIKNFTQLLNEASHKISELKQPTSPLMTRR